jgi:hypothetical protein
MSLGLNAVSRLMGCLGMACLLLAESATAQTQSNPGVLPEIEYGYPEQSIFVATVNADGRADSPMTNVAAALMEKVGIPWHAAPYPAARLFSNLRNGTTGFSILVRATSLEACCIFSRRPIYSTDLNLYYLGDKPPIRTRDDLVGKSIIVIRGYSYAGLLELITNPAHRTLVEIAGTHKAAFEMLQAGRADYVLDYASAAGEILAGRSIKNLRSSPIDRLDIHMVLSKTYPDAERLMVRLEAAVRTLDVQKLLTRRGGDK